MNCIIPLLSSFDGRAEKEPRKLDTCSNVTSEMDLCRDYNESGFSTSFKNIG